MKTWHDLTEAERLAMAHLHGRYTLLDSLTERVDEAGDEELQRHVPSVGSGRMGWVDILHRIASEPDFDPGAETLARIAETPRLSRDLDALTRRYAVDICRPLAAASSDGMDVDRDAELVTLRIRTTSRSTREVYLIIEPRQDAEPPPSFRKLVAHRADGSIAILVVGDGEALPLQRLLPIDDPFVIAVRNWDSRIDLL